MKKNDRHRPIDSWEFWSYQKILRVLIVPWTDTTNATILGQTGSEKTLLTDIRLLTLLYCDCRNGWSHSPLPLCFMGMIHVALLSRHGQIKETAAREPICVNLQVLILFNMAIQLMNIHCRKKVLPSTTILCQVQTAQTRRRRPASNRNSSVNSRNSLSS